MDDHAAMGTGGEEEPVPDEAEHCLTQAKGPQDTKVVAVVKGIRVVGRLCSVLNHPVGMV